ncbi:MULTISPECIES: metal-dependent hydrolase family protein [unclassified Streptomyces]|uniref:metal-dependent hydrolase family protein n=1 Tax=unclassified Streptomyces TaxID=2593676 RepID=UPI002E2CEC7E|nr:amidohydrolase family protein [Streptomyces sp. NBC_00223]
MDIRHVHVVDPEGERVLQDRRITLDGDRITAVTADTPGPAAPGDLDGTGLYAVPGFIDCHVHVTSVSADEWADTGMAASYVTAHALRELRAMLERGFTTVRDAGGADAGLADALDEGIAPGPRLYVCGRALSQTGGHGDLRPRGRHHADDHPAVPGIGRVVDGADALRTAVREGVRSGASFVKLMLSGGISSPTDRIDTPQYSEDEIRAAVDEARRAGVYCAGHAYTPQAVARALRLGVRTIEHGNLIGPPEARLFAEYDAYYVPTLVTYTVLADEGPGYGLPPVSVAKVAAVRDSGLAALGHAHAAGAAIAFGTDLLGRMHVHQSAEFALRARAQPGWAVLRSATTTGARLLGADGELGVIAAGARADVVLTRHNPGTHIGLLADPRAEVAAVISRGRLAIRR